MITGLIGVCIGAYAVLDQTFLGGHGAWVLALGVLVSVAGIAAAGRRVGRTVYRPDPWLLPETLVALTGMLVGGVGWWVDKRAADGAQQRRGAAPGGPRRDRQRGDRDRRHVHRRAVARRRDENGAGGRGVLHWPLRYLGSVETSLSHLVRSRVRSADEPYLPKS